MKRELKDLAKTAKDVATGLAKTGKFLSKDPDHRMKICQACECFDNHRCSRAKCPPDKDGKNAGCNCYMPVKIKLEFATCPKKKW